MFVKQPIQCIMTAEEVYLPFEQLSEVLSELENSAKMPIMLRFVKHC